MRLWMAIAGLAVYALLAPLTARAQTFPLPDAPALYDAVPDAAAGTTTVIGRATATPSTALTMRFYSSASCDEGQLGGDPTLLGTIPAVTTDADGKAYFAQTLAAVPPSASFVAARATTDDGGITPMSR